MQPLLELLQDLTRANKTKSTVGGVRRSGRYTLT